MSRSISGGGLLISCQPWRLPRPPSHRWPFPLATMETVTEAEVHSSLEQALVGRSSQDYQ
eukprot:5924303-Pyramimonas_sp.AAC.1